MPIFSYRCFVYLVKIIFNVALCKLLMIPPPPLNEYFIIQNNAFRKFDSRELYIYGRMEYWIDNHLMLPVYRSVKTGIHLSNLGDMEKVL
ncbi:hypothetical protein SAMN02745150_01224 [Brevinema andersonii]|uniref:Uncharacterized protein n=1 Tax=Brevinema andersonii TaxID=34097 RepID=A0A1I1EQF3_BREAD|nr:hypothetical protein [Brevinema andersonii]SFB89409.1 hypothetical protein SAMN02745150_01224 [Brevinema andersonii]